MDFRGIAHPQDNTGTCVGGEIWAIVISSLHTVKHLQKEKVLRRSGRVWCLFHLSVEKTWWCRQKDLSGDCQGFPGFEKAGGTLDFLWLVRHRIKPVESLRISGSVKFIFKKVNHENLWIALMGFCCVVPRMFYWDPWFILDGIMTIVRKVLFAPERQNVHIYSVATSLQRRVLKEPMLSFLTDKVQICMIKIGSTLKGKKSHCKHPCK